MALVDLYETDPVSGLIVPLGAQTVAFLDAAHYEGRKVYRWKQLQGALAEPPSDPTVPPVPGPPLPPVTGFSYTPFSDVVRPAGFIGQAAAYFDANPYTLPGSGTLSIATIRNELQKAGMPAYNDLGNITNWAFGGGPYNIARFYGYTATKRVTASGYWQNADIRWWFGGDKSGIICEFTIAGGSWLTGYVGSYGLHFYDDGANNPIRYDLINYGLVSGQGGSGGYGQGGSVIMGNWPDCAGGPGGQAGNALYVNWYVNVYNKSGAWIMAGAGGGGGGGGSGYNDLSGGFATAGGGGGGGGISGYPLQSSGAGVNGPVYNPGGANVNGNNGANGWNGGPGGGGAGGNYAPYAVGADGGSGGGSWGGYGNNGNQGFIQNFGGGSAYTAGGSGGPPGYWYWRTNASYLNLVENSGSIAGWGN